MGSQTPTKLPVIDLSSENLKPGTSCWLSACNDVRCGLEEYGCFVALFNSKVPSEVCNTIFGSLEELFHLPTDIKIQHTTTEPFHGYDGHCSSIPLFESFGIFDATNHEKTQSFTDLMWPAGNHRFCESADLCIKQVAELDKMVTRMVFGSYDLEKYYDSHVASTTYFLRLTKYRVPQMNETNLGLHNHTDKTFITILHQNQVNGLEIKTKDGEWIAYEPCLPSSFLVLAGDAFKAWSNDRVHAPLHRVTMSGNEVRYSLGLFTFSNGMIQTPKELVDDDHPLRFKPFDHIGLRRFLDTDEGREAESKKRLIEAYCGV